MIFINDLVNLITCPYLLYADDLKIYSTVRDFKDCLVLNRDLAIVANWCVPNKMSLNVEKCFVICFGSIKKKINYASSLNGIELQRKSVVRDLEIFFDDKLNFHYHYDQIILKSTQLLGFIFRSTKAFNNQLSLIYLYCSLIRSVLEYGSVIWSLYYKVHSKRIGSVQNKFLKVLCY